MYMDNYAGGVVVLYCRVLQCNCTTHLMAPTTGKSQHQDPWLSPGWTRGKWVSASRECERSYVSYPFSISNVSSVSSGGFPVVKQEQLSPRSAASSQAENLSTQDSAASRGEFGTNHHPSSQFTLNSKRLKCRNRANTVNRLKTVLTLSHRPHASCSGWQHHKGHPWHTCAPRTSHII